MASPCNEDISKYELLGRILNETPQINKNGTVKEAAMYPKRREDEDRKGKFTNKISMVRICRGQNPDSFSWTCHSDIAQHFIRSTNIIFRGFLVAQAAKIIDFGFMIFRLQMRRTLITRIL